uniref:26S proteasome non-ATPase regulatory subunit 5 n=1 Tax=Rhabditophanes sp. KR3021 TaxID=114890 RepID=A0AC35TRQ0_9BILA
MNAKRRKLNSEDVSASEFVFQSFKTEDYLAILKDLSFIKQKFCKTKIDDESKNEQILSQIFVLVDLFYKIVNNNEYNADKQQSKVLQEAISIIANLCYYSSAAKLYMSKARNPAILFSTLEQLLKKDNVLDKIKNNILRLVGNLILAPCTMVYFTTNDTLLSKIADFLGAEDENQKENAIKIFKNFASMKFPAAFLNNSAIQRIGEMILVEEQITKYKEDLIKILYFTFSYMKTVAGKQLAITQCPTLLLSKLQGYVNEETEDSEWSRCICSILNKSHDVREAIGTSGLISFIDNGKECLSFWKVLSYFAQDAWGRVTLREYSGLDLIINHLLTSNDVVEKCLLYEALRHFIHDSVGIAYLCMKGDLFRPEFIERIVRTQII